MTTDTKSPKLIFHIGHHKTGSTSIQNALAKKAIRVEGAEIFYPAVLTHNYLRKYFDDFIKTGKAPRATPGTSSLAGIEKKLLSSDADFAVFSGESFEGIDPVDFRSVLERFFLPHVSGSLVICYVRPHAARTLSSFCENTKIGRFDGTPSAFHKKWSASGHLKYVRRTAPWFKTFQDGFILRPMERSALHRGSVVEDFAHVAFDGKSRSITVEDLPMANESLSVEDLILLRLMHRQLGKQPKEISLRMGWELARLLGSETVDGPRTKPALHKSLAEQVRKDYLADAKEMDRLYCGGSPLFVTELDKSVDIAVSKEQNYEPEAHFSASVMREITAMSRLAGEMLGNADGQWRKFMAELSGTGATGGPASKSGAIGSAGKEPSGAVATKGKSKKTGSAIAKTKKSGKGKQGGKGVKVRTGTLPKPTIFGAETAAPEQDLLVLRRLKSEIGKRPKPLSQAVLRRAAFLMQPKAHIRGSSPSKSTFEKILARLPGLNRKKPAKSAGTNVKAMMNRLEKMPENNSTKLPPNSLRAVSVISRLVDGMLDNNGKPWPKFLHRRRLKDLELKK